VLGVEWLLAHSVKQPMFFETAVDAESIKKSNGHELFGRLYAVCSADFSTTKGIKEI